jgi:CubicO group peptidase (beta-lactamase class C family)
VGILVRARKLDPRAPAAIAEWQTPGDPRRAITLDMLLRASSGLAWSETYEASPFASDVIAMLYRAGHRDMAAFAASKPLAHPVDTVWSYSSGSTLLVSRLVRQALGGGEPELRAFARRELFAPLGIASAVLEADASGTFVGSSYAWMTARDWARFGLLYLRDGVWDGQRLLPPGWVDYARTPTPTAPHGEYGAQFWLSTASSGAPRDLFHASGHDGQQVAIVPSRDLVVVRLAITPSDGRFDSEGFGGAVARCFSSD